VRNRIRQSRSGTPRLSVFRSNNHMYAQIIDDGEGITLVAASTLEKDLYGAGNRAGNREAAAKIGKLLAERAVAKGLRKVTFDRGSYKFHGRVAALAGAARDGGLEF